MPTILDAGSTPLSNVDVLVWIRAKRAQIAREDADDKTNNRPKAHRPSNFMNSLRRHEQDLSDDKYPFIKNPSAYEGPARNKIVKVLIERCDEEICFPLEAQYQSQGMTLKQLKLTLGEAHKKKTLTISELMMIHNLAPENTSILERVIDSWESRFTTEEMEKIVSIIKEVYRPDENPSDQVDAS